MDAILNKVQKEYGYSDYEIKLIKFSITGIFYDLSKTLIFLIYFSAVGKFMEFIFAAVPLILLRTKTGGIHLKKYWSCFMFSLIYFFAVIYALPTLITVHPLVVYLILLICAVMDYMLGPNTLSKRPAPAEDFIKKAKIQSFQVIFIVAILFFIFPDVPYLIVSFWTVVLHTVQLSIAKLLKEVKHHEELA
ncbi:MAG: accessory gene regulator B family protein [Butyrivibrio sp.]|nr:accessory gene regulator B family protein [Butyrivibrio sp.]